MFLSIIIPVYNAEKYLAECLDSCLNQNLPPEDYEILCVNDGSKDQSAEILAAYESGYSNVRVLTKENGGVSSARNLGLDHARGDYIWFVDADDVIAEKALIDLKKPAKVSADRFLFHGKSYSANSGGEQSRIDAANNVVWLNLFSRHFLAEHAIRFRTETAYGEDTLFIFEVILHGALSIRLDVDLYYLRSNDSSATKQTSNEKQIKMVNSYFFVGRAMKEELERNSMMSSELRTFTVDQMLMVMRKGLEILARLPGNSRAELLKQLRSEGLYPIGLPAERTYTARECMNEPSGTGKLRNLFRYYSVYPWGLFLASVPYSAQRIKICASRALRANPVMNRALDLKNRLLGR